MTFLDKVTTLAQLQELEQSFLSIGLSMLVGYAEPTSEFAEAKTEGKPKSKPQCVKGTACGYSCISGKLQCSDKVQKRDADALIAASKGTRTEGALSAHRHLEGESAAKTILSFNSRFYSTGDGSVLSDKAIDDDDELAQNYEGILDRISDLAAEYKPNSAKYGSVLLASAAADEDMVAAAYVTKKNDGSTELDYLLGSPLAYIGTDSEKAKVRGGGSSMLKQVAKLAIDHAKAESKQASLTLQALQTAKAFYEKLGATPIAGYNRYAFNEAALLKLAELT